MTDRDIMQQALDALRQCEFTSPPAQRQIVKNALAALNERLAQPEQEQEGPICDGWQLSVADGHSGYGVYAHMDDYPDEGAVLVLPIEQPAQPEKEIDWKDQYEKQKRRAEMWRDKYEAIAGPDECVYPAQPEQEFIKHHGDDEGWSEWVCPDPKDYLMKCCDCGLVHQAQFRVAKYAPALSEECEIVNDPDLQAQFRMRRSEQWSPEDTAYRPGGLAQPEQQEQWDAIPDAFNEWWNADYDDTGNPYRKDSPAYWAWSGWKAASKQPEQESVAWIYRDSWGTMKLSQVTPPPVGAFPVYTTPPQRKPLSDEEIDDLSRTMVKGSKSVNWLCRAIEAAHGIKGEA